MQDVFDSVGLSKIIERLPTMSKKPRGHLVTRVSDPSQARGEGPARQRGYSHEQWCKANGVVWSGRVYDDEGVSAWRGSNWEDDAELGRFLREAREGVHVRRGDYLLVSNWDRLVRVDPWRAISYFQRLRDLGINLVRLDTGIVVEPDRFDAAAFFDVALTSMRSHDESNQKSEVIRKALDEKRRRAREQGALFTKQLPAWLEIVPCSEDDAGARLLKLAKREMWVLCRVRPEAGETIRRAFEMAAQGLGALAICRLFREERIKPFAGRAWNATYIGKLLNDERLLGKCQLRGRTAKASVARNRPLIGEAIADYFPRVVSEDLWYAARAEKGRRQQCKGRAGQVVNLFKGLLFLPASDLRYQIGSIRATEPGNMARCVQAPIESWTERGICRFDLQTLEKEMGRWFAEIDLAGIVEGGSAVQRETVLRGQLEALRAEQAALLADAEQHGSSKLHFARARQLEAQESAVADELETIRYQAAHPLSVAWTDAKALWQTVLATDCPAERRLRLRQRLYETVERFYLMVVQPSPQVRLAVLQGNLVGGAVRHWFIRHARENRGFRYSDSGSVLSASFRASAARLLPLDLGRAEDAAALRDALLVFPDAV